MKLLKVDEVCESLRLGRNTVYELLRRTDGLRSVRIGRSIRISEAEVERFIAERESAGLAASP